MSSQNSNIILYRAIGGAVIMFFISLYLIFSGISGMMDSSAGAIDLTDPHVKWEDLEAGDRIEMDLPYMGDYYLEYTRAGNPVSRRYLYPLLDFSDSLHGEINMYLTFKCSRDEIDDYESIRANLKQNGYTSFHIISNSTTYHISGKLRKMSSTEEQYLRDYLGDLGYTGAAADRVYLPYVVEPSGTNTNRNLAVGLVLMAVSATLTAFIVIQLKRQ
ncbi:MAG: hypothetical protein IKT14_00920 [Clostridiales bacterium]|nr:hypothetical protein [Clostridiales bacterium]MBR6483554.1 hypothetical protein [Clostridiales bacterium]